MIKNFFSQLREYLGLEEVLFLGGMVLLYYGLSTQFGHAVAQIGSGAVFISVSLLIVFKGAK